MAIPWKSVAMAQAIAFMAFILQPFLPRISVGFDLPSWNDPDLALSASITLAFFACLAYLPAHFAIQGLPPQASS